MNGFMNGLACKTDRHDLTYFALENLAVNAGLAIFGFFATKLVMGFIGNDSKEEIE